MRGKVMGSVGFLALIAIVSLAALGADDHGNTPLAATPISVDGTLVAGCIETPGDLDYFLFTATGGRRMIVRTSHLSTEMDTVLYLFGMDGATILAVDDNSDGGKASKIEWTFPVSGTYFAMVRHAQATTGTGCYELSVSLVQEDDHGNDAATASPITTDGKAVPGYIETGGDVDFFLFSAEGGWRYALGTGNLTAGMDPVIDLYDRDGRTLLAQDDNSGGGKSARILWTAPATGTYFAAVRHADPAGTGGYEFSITRGGYADDYGNDSTSARSVPTDGSTVAGAIEVQGDVDFFAFSASAAGEYTILLAGQDETSNWSLALYATDGRTVLSKAEQPAGKGQTIQWTAPSAGTYSIAVQRGKAGGTGPYTLSIRAILKLVEVGSFASRGYATSVWVEGDRAYLIVGVAGLLILDVSDPAAPREIGSHSTTGYAQAVAVSGKYAYVADRGGGLVIVDVSNPAAPVQAASVKTPGSAQGVSLRGKYACVADQQGGLQVIDIGNPAQPQIVGAWATAGFAQGVFLTERYAFVAVGSKGLEVVDLADPKKPVGSGRLGLPGEANAVVVSANRAYVACGYSGIQVVDVSDPARPTLLFSYDTAGEASGLFLAGSYLYVADQSAGVIALSTLDPANLRPVAEFDTPGNAVGLFVTKELAFVADRDKGLRILRLFP